MKTWQFLCLLGALLLINSSIQDFWVSQLFYSLVGGGLIGFGFSSINREKKGR